MLARTNAGREPGRARGGDAAVDSPGGLDFDLDLDLDLDFDTPERPAPC